VKGGFGLGVGLNTLKERKGRLRPTNANLFSPTTKDKQEEARDDDATPKSVAVNRQKFGAASSTKVPPAVPPTTAPVTAAPALPPLRSPGNAPGGPKCVANGDQGPPGAPPVGVATSLTVSVIFGVFIVRFISDKSTVSYSITVKGNKRNREAMTTRHTQTHRHTRSPHISNLIITRNSSADEISNVNFYDIVLVLRNTKKDKNEQLSSR